MYDVDSSGFIVDKQLHAYNTRDIETFLDCYSDDIQVIMLESNDLLTNGKGQLKKTMQESFKSNSNSITEILSRIYQKNLVIDQEKLTGHIEGKIVTTIAIYQVIDNKITKLWFGGRKLK